MLRRTAFPLLLAVVLAAALIFGITRLFTLRFDHGDVYPPYSTLRADPLGAKALFEALEEMPGLELRRNFRPLVQLKTEGNAALVYAGVSRQSEWGIEELQDFQRRIALGGRAVFTFQPERLQAPAKPAEKPPIKSAEKDAPVKTKPEPGDFKDRAALTFADVAERLGFRFQRFTGEEGDAVREHATIAAGAPSLEPRIPWHSTLYFTDLHPGWQTLYICRGRPVVIERPFGAGTIVLAGDSYFLSNEALRRERSPQLLAWLAGPARTIVFDEEHHNVTETANVATLARKYRLHGLVAGLLLLIGLFLWQSLTPFLPALATRGAEATLVAGRGASEGLVNLLRRAVPPGDVLAVCAQEWRKTFDPDARSSRATHLDGVLAQEQVRKARERQPVQAYETIRQHFSKKE